MMLDRHFKNICLAVVFSVVMGACAPTLSQTVDQASAREQGKKFNQEASALFERGDVSGSLKKMDEALRLFRQAGDYEAEGATLYFIGLANLRLAEYQKTLTASEEGLVAIRKASGGVIEGLLLGNLGEAHFLTNDAQKAGDYFRQALTIWQKLNQPREASNVLLRLGDLYAKTGESQREIESYKQLLSIWRDLGEAEQEFLTLTELGLIYDGLKNYDEAVKYFDQALQQARRAGRRKDEAQSNNRIGVVFLNKNEEYMALNYFNEALGICRAEKDREGEALILGNIGRVQKRVNENPKAIESFEKALALWRSLGDRRNIGQTMVDLGEIYEKSGSPQEALRHFTQSLEIWREIPDPEKEAYALDSIGLVYRQTGQSIQAIENYEKALAIWRTIKNPRGEALTLNNLGAAYFKLRELEKALDYLKRSLEIREKTGASIEKAATLNNIGEIYSELNRPQDAMEYFRRAIELTGEADRAILAKITVNLGGLYRDLGEQQKAQEHFSRAVAMLEPATSIDDKNAKASAINFLADFRSEVADHRKALEYYNQSLGLWRSTGDRLSEIDTINRIGLEHAALSDYQKALELFFNSLSLGRTVSHPPGRAASLNNIGFTYYHIGDSRKAVEYFEQSLALNRESGDESGVASAINNIGAAYQNDGELDKALDYFQKSLPLLQKIGGRANEASTLGNIGECYAEKNDPQKAFEYLNRALEIHRSIGNRVGEATALSNLGKAYRLTGDKNQALDHYNRALAIWRDAGNLHGEAKTLNNIAALYSISGDREKALDHHLQSIAVQEKIRGAATLDEIRASLAAESTNDYANAIALSIRLGRNDQAFELSERARARSFLDQLGNLRIDLRKSADRELIEQEQALLGELSAIERRLAHERSRTSDLRNEFVINSLSSQIQVKQKKYEELLTRIKLTSPEYSSLRNFDPLKLSEIQKLIDRDTTILSYFVTSQETYSFIVTREDFRVVTLPVNAAMIRDQLALIRPFLDLDESKPSGLKVLYDYLITPVKEHLKTPIVGVIPHDSLHYLPFSALTDGKVFFNDEHTIFYLPSLSTLQFIQKSSQKSQSAAGDRALAMANPQARGLSILTNAESEARAVGEIFKSRPLIGAAATESALKSLAGDAQIIHLIAHGEFNNASPLFSRIVLSPDDKNDGLLEVREVYSLDLAKTGLVVLSACQTQLGARSLGDDVIGLNRAFLYAGAPTVIASLWKVEDEATGFLMKSFYGHLKGGKSKAEALREAQRETRMKPQFQHPYYWSAFVLTGDNGTLRNTRNKP